jgi:hypothetical protein
MAGRKAIFVRQSNSKVLFVMNVALSPSIRRHECLTRPQTAQYTDGDKWAEDIAAVIDG